MNLVGGAGNQVSFHSRTLSKGSLEPLFMMLYCGVGPVIIIKTESCEVSY